MKFYWNKVATARTISNIFVVVVGITFCMTLLNLKSIGTFISSFMVLIRPFFYGFAIAYLLSSPVKYFEKMLSFLDRKKSRPKVKRALAVTIAMILTLILISAILAIVFPQLLDSIFTLVNNFQTYINNVEALSLDFIAKYDIDPNLYESLSITWEQIIGQSSTFLVTFLQQVIGLTSQITTGVLNVFIAIIVAIYFLTSKEKFFAQIKKLLYALIPQRQVEHAIYLSQLTNRTFNGFINGKLLDSLIIGIITFICLNLMQMPYALLISVIIGITNIIPFFGPFIGAIPSTFIIFIIDPMKALWFILFILLLQQFDGNILGPKILGNSTGLPAIWVMFAILVSGGMFGFIGMLLGVPTFAVIYIIAKDYLENKLKRKGMPHDTKEYSSEDHPIIF